MAKPTVEQLYEEHDRHLRRCIYLLIRDFDDSVNVTYELSQETWIKVMRFYHSIGEDANILAWLIRIAKNTAIDWMRRQKNMQMKFTHQVNLISSYEHDNMRDPEEIVLMEETISTTYRQMSDAEVIAVQHHGEGYKLKEIPAILKEKAGISYKQKAGEHFVRHAREHFTTLYQQQ